MRSCPGCDRHVRLSETTCPFCRAPLRLAPAPITGPILSMALGCTLAMGAFVAVGCGPSVAVEPEGSARPGPDDQGTGDGVDSADSLSDTGRPATSDGTSTADTTFGGSTDTEDAPDPMTTSVGFIYGGGLDVGSSFECDVFAQDCPDGEKCSVYSSDGGTWNGTRCAPIADDPNAVGEPCTAIGSAISGLDDCEIGAMCFFVDPETNVGECVSLCQGDAASPLCEDSATTCTVSNEGSLVLCLEICDPFVPMCSRGQACAPIDDEWVCAPVVPEGPGPGEPCEFIDVCTSGTACVEAAHFTDCEGAAGCCAQVCDLDEADPDAACTVDPAQVCTPWFPDGPGLCVLP